MKILLTIKQKRVDTKIECPTVLAAIRELLAYATYDEARDLQDEVDSFVKEGVYEP